MPLRRLYLLLTLLPALLSAQTNVPDGTAIAANTTWTAAGSPWIVEGLVTINATRTLTIQAGATVQFQTDARIVVNGTLSGPSTGSTFTSFSAAPDNWYIQVNNGGAANLTACTLSNGAYFAVNTGGSATLTNCTTSELYWTNSGTLNLVGGSSTYAQGNPVVNAVSGSTTLNGIALDGQNVASVGVEATSGTLNMQSVTINNTVYPVNLVAPVTLSTSGTHTFSGNTYTQVRAGFSTLSANWTTPALPIAYVFPSGLTVNSGTVWTLSPNAIIKAGNGTEIVVLGRMNAVAGVGQSIKFVSLLDDNNGGDANGDAGNSAPGTSDWAGIRFQTGANTASTLTRCEVRHGGGGLTGGINIVACAPALNTCTFQQNHIGVVLRDGSTASIVSCTFGSSGLTPLAMTLDANPTFTTNTFSFQDNQYDAIGLIQGTMPVNGNIIQRNVVGINNVTYVLLQDLTIPVGRTLSVAAGVVLKSYGAHLLVEGTLNVNGTSTQKVIFTSVGDDSVGNPGDTNRDGNISQPTSPIPYNIPGAIAINDAAAATLTYLEMRYANGGYNYPFGQDTELYGYALVDFGGNTQLNNCTFRDGQNGVVCLDGATTVLNTCAFVNMAGVPVAIKISSDPTFTNVTFTNVGLTALGIIGGTLNANGALEQRNLAGYTNITQVLLSNLTIANGVNVDVQAGVVLKLGYIYGATNIYVNGGLKLSGTAGQNVVFTSWLDDNYGNPGDTNQDLATTQPAAGDWGGIHYNASANDPYNTITYARLRYGGSGCNCIYDHSNDFGVLDFINAGGSVQNSTLEFNWYGATFRGASNPVMNACTIDGSSKEPFGQFFEATPSLSNITLGSQNNNNGIRLLTYVQGFDASLQPGLINGFGPVAYVTAGFTISPTATLTIQPGTAIKLEGYDITVQGGLVAVGTPSSKIVFTSLNDDSVYGDTNNDGNAALPAAGNWGSITFAQGSLAGVNHLRHCRMNYGGAWFSTRGNVRFESTGGLVEDCSVEFSYYAAFDFIGSANPTVQNNFINLISFAPVHMSAFASPTLTNNTISNVSILGIALLPEVLPATGTFPKRALAGFDPIGYYVYSPMTVPNGVTITVQPGTVFKSNGSAVFNVQGRLDVLGTVAQPAVFTMLADDAHGLPGDMNQDGASTVPTVSGANYLNYLAVSDDASVVEHALFRYGNSGVSTVSARPRVRRSTFERCTWGAVCSGIESPYLPYNTYTDLDQAPVVSSILTVPDSLIGTVMNGTTKRMIGILNETLLQDVTLPKRDLGSVVNAPYYFREGFSVGTSATLTIAQGVVCKFAQSAGLTVNRGLQAVGAAGPATTIVLTHEGDDFYGGDSNGDGSTAPGAWGGITFENASVDADCDIVRSIIRHASTAVTCNSASPVVNNTLIQNCTNGVVANLISDPVVSNNDFTGISNLAVNNVGGAFTINAENCWWGNNTGPTHSGNPGGTGMAVTNLVDYSPYRTTGAQVPLMGDVSLNGAVQAFDASQVLQYTASLLTLNATQLQVGDVTGNGGVTALDASHILQHVVGLRPTFDAELGMAPGGGQQMMMQPAPVALSIADGLATAGDTFTVDVSVAGVTELYSLQFTVNFDAAHLQLHEVQSLLPETFAWVHGVPGSGTVVCSAASPYALTQDGVVFRLTFIAGPDLANELITYAEPTAVLVDEVDMTQHAVHGILTLLPGLSTGLNDLTDALGVLVYPNPAIDGFTVTWASGGTGAVQLSLFDLTGRIVYDRRVSPMGGSSVRIERGDLGPQAAGPHMLRVAQGDMVKWVRIVLDRP